MVSLLGAQDRVAIVEGTLEVSEGHGSWGTGLGTEMGGSEAGTDSGESRKSDRVANIFGGMSEEAAGLQGRLEGLGGGQNLLATGRGGTHGCPPSTVLPWGTYEEQGGGV